MTLAAQLTRLLGKDRVATDAPTLATHATDKWFAHETGRKFRQLAELEKGLEHKFITQDATINWRKTHRLDWLLGVEVVLPRLFFVAFLAMAVWVCWPHAADVFALLRQMLP